MEQRGSSIRPLRLAWPRTPPFHGGDTGSNPVGDAKYQKGHFPLGKWPFFFDCLSNSRDCNNIEGH